MSDYLVTLYTSPGCMGCRLTKRALDAAGVPYRTRDVTVDEPAAQAVRRLGYQGLPVVTVSMEDGMDHWTGYDPMRLAAVAELAGATS